MSDTPDTQTDAGAPSTPGAECAPPSANAPHPLDHLIASIRAAVGTDASPEARAIGATACRSLLTALEATSGQPLGAARPAAAPAAPAAAPASPIAGLLAQLASMPRDKQFELLKQLVTSPRSPIDGILSRLAALPREQLIALINQQLRALAPTSAPASPPAGPRFHMISIPQAPRRSGAP